MVSGGWPHRSVLFVDRHDPAAARIVPHNDRAGAVGPPDPGLAQREAVFGRIAGRVQRQLEPGDIAQRR